MAGGAFGAFVGFCWSYIGYRPGPSDNSESSSRYALDVGSFYGGWLGAILGGLVFCWCCRRYLRRADMRAHTQLPEQFPSDTPIPEPK